MTKQEFLSKVPPSITVASGTKSLRIDITIDSKFQKGACYRDEQQVAACYALGDWWHEVYLKLMNHVESRGYIIKAHG